MQSPHGIIVSVFRLKFFTLLFLAALSATILIGCERQLLSPIDPTDPSQTTVQLAQKALSELADTAAELSFVEFANAASGVAEILAIEDGASVEPTYFRIVELARSATAFAQVFVKAGCEVEALQKFGEASVNVAKAYTIRDAEDMEQALQKLAQAAVTAEKLLQQFLTNDTFIPFAFGYDYTPYRANNLYIPGQILVAYDDTIRPETETRTAIKEFLTLKGYTVELKTGSWFDSIVLDVAVDPLFLGEGLIEKIPGIASVQPNFLYAPTVDDEPPLPPPLPPNIVTTNRIIHQVRTRYNKAWCQGNFDLIDSILIEESGLDFFDYAFIRNLADIYAEEIPEAAERIQTNRYSPGSIAAKFLEIYFQDSEKTLDEIIELFRQSVRNRHVTIEDSYW